MSLFSLLGETKCHFIIFLVGGVLSDFFIPLYKMCCGSTKAEECIFMCIHMTISEFSSALFHNHSLSGTNARLYSDEFQLRDVSNPVTPTVENLSVFSCLQGFGEECILISPPSR